jgi:ribonuclease HII
MHTNAHTRLQHLLAFDAEQSQAWSAAQSSSETRRSPILIGVDEVGRGSLIGPVVAAACAWRIAPDATQPLAPGMERLNDSKKMSPAHRARLLPVLEATLYAHIEEADANTIARLNIVQASLYAAVQAVKGVVAQLPITDQQGPFLVLMDGRDALPDLLPPAFYSRPIIRGDAQSALIAAASVLAKEHRDAWVRHIALDYPVYGWQRNMGYATPSHRKALAQHGLTPHHRPSYACLPQNTMP